MSVPEITQPADHAEIETLLDLAFGADRQKKTTYRLRDGIEPVHELCFVLREAGRLRGSIAFWRIRIRPDQTDDAAVPALLLGPLAVDPHLRGQGLGLRLIMRGLTEARRHGHKIVILVGDLGYYGRFGFRRAAPGQFVFPGPVDEDRILVQELEPGALDGVAGVLEAWSGKSTRRKRKTRP